MRVRAAATLARQPRDIQSGCQRRAGLRPRLVTRVCVYRMRQQQTKLGQATRAQDRLRDTMPRKAALAAGACALPAKVQVLLARGLDLHAQTEPSRILSCVLALVRTSLKSDEPQQHSLLSQRPRSLPARDL